MAKFGAMSRRDAERQGKQWRHAVDQAIVRVLKATDRDQIIKALLATINDDTLTRETNRRVEAIVGDEVLAELFNDDDED